MELTIKQEQGLQLALARFRNHEPYTVISGYAGSGKSTLIKFIIAALDVAPERVAYAAYTGKAAQVLRNKGNLDAMTTHRLLYKSVPKPDGTFMHIPKVGLKIEYDVIVIDEVSMLPKEMWELLLSHKIYVIACGDPGQLPPIGEENGILDHPHIFLDEIMRQAQESEIIRLSMDIRDKKAIKPFHGKEINIVPCNELCDGMLMWADQVICGKNITRYQMNDYYRQMLWDMDPQAPVDTTPRIGDKLICLKNDWDIISPIGDALVNGTIGQLASIDLGYNPKLGIKTANIDFIPDGPDSADYNTIFTNVPIDWKLLTLREPTINKDNWRLFKRTKLEQFDYGYCITAHKSQGSEYPKVLVIEEMLKGSEHERWLYTACTRASEKLTLVLRN